MYVGIFGELAVPLVSGMQETQFKVEKAKVSIH